MSIQASTRQGQISPPQLDPMALDFAQQVSKVMVQLDIDIVYKADQTCRALFTCLINECSAPVVCINI